MSTDVLIRCQKKDYKMNEDEHIEDLAKEYVNNHAKFNCFHWHDEPEDSETKCIVYTHNRDSGLLDMVNAKSIEKEIEPHLEGNDAEVFRASHWGPGWVEGYVIRVYNNKNEITEAFKTYAKCALALQEYPVLDDSLHSEMEYEAQLESIEHNAPSFGGNEPPEDWPSRVFGWLWENNQDALEYEGDPYVTEEDIGAALTALGIEFDND